MLTSKHLWISAGLALFLAACQSDRDSTGPDELPGEEPSGGRVVQEDGRPAAGARVTFYPAGHSPKDGNPGAAIIRQADDSGRYRIDSLAAGLYTLVGTWDSSLFFRDSVRLGPDVKLLDPDTVREGGAIRGRVELEPGFSPRLVTVEVLGTDFMAEVDSSSRFELSGLPEGTYQLRITSEEAGYQPTLSTVSVEAGKATELPQPLSPRFTGVPSVKGLRVTLDTVTGVASLRWNRLENVVMEHYAIIRYPDSPDASSQLPVVGKALDTVFRDTVRKSDTASGFKVVYKVGVKTANERIQAISKPFPLDVPAQGRLRTNISIAILDAQEGVVSIGDTVRLVAAYENPTRSIKTVRWNIPGLLATGESTSVSTNQGEDTLLVMSPAEGDIAIEFIAVDEKGDEWRQQARFKVTLDKPVALAGTDTVFAPGDTLRLLGGGADGFGRIVKWEWDPGGTGAFKSVSGPDTVLGVSSRRDGSAIHVLRVTDDDGLTALDTVIFEFSAYRIVPEFPQAVNAWVATFQEKEGFLSIFAQGGMARVWRYHPASKHWSPLAGSPVEGDYFTGIRIDRHYFLYSMDRAKLWQYDLDADRWTPKADGLTVGYRTGANLHNMGGKILAILDGRSSPRAMVWDPQRDLWTPWRSVGPDGRYFSWKDRILVMDWTEKMWEFRLSDSTWHGPATFGKALGIYLPFRDGLYFFGSGYEVYRFEPESGTWSERKSALNPWLTPDGPNPNWWIIVGGENKAHLVLDMGASVKIFTYDIAEGEWSETSVIAMDFSPEKAALIGNSLFIHSEKSVHIEYVLPGE